jgi:hypothetical protein
MFVGASGPKVAQSKTPGLEAKMRSKLRSTRLFRWLAACGTAIALAAPSASAAPVEQFLDHPRACETQWIAEYQLLDLGSQAQRSCEEPVRSVSGTATPTEDRAFPGLAAAARDIPRVESTEPGFDWASAAIGAATAVGLLALAFVAALATSRRGRPGTAR